GQIGKRNTTCGIRPSELTAETGVTECRRRVRPAESAQVGFTVVTRDHDAKRTICDKSAKRILESGIADSECIAQHLGLPNLLSIIRAAVVQKRLVEQREVAGSRNSTTRWR